MIQLESSKILFYCLSKIKKNYLWLEAVCSSTDIIQYFAMLYT
jgi:hypothetical protein